MERKKTIFPSPLRAGKLLNDKVPYRALDKRRSQPHRDRDRAMEEERQPLLSLHFSQAGLSTKQLLTDFQRGDFHTSIPPFSRMWKLQYCMNEEVICSQIATYYVGIVCPWMGLHLQSLLENSLISLQKNFLPAYKTPITSDYVYD